MYSGQKPKRYFFVSTRALQYFLENMNRRCGYLQSPYDKIRIIPFFFTSPSIYLNNLQAVVNCDCVSFCLHLILILRHVMNPDRFFERESFSAFSFNSISAKEVHTSWHVLLHPHSCQTYNHYNCSFAIWFLWTVWPWIRYHVNEHLKKDKRKPGQTCTWMKLGW